MKVEKITTRIGARISGIDLRQPLASRTAVEIRALLAEHAAIFFVGQAPLSGEEHVSFAANFGEIHLPEFRTRASTRPEVMILDQVAPKGQGADNWHADSTFLARPPSASILQAHVMPVFGGDTCFSSMYAAYDALSPALQSLFEGLTASHSPVRLIERTRAVAAYGVDKEMESRPAVSHPMVVVHPDTGRRMLFVNSGFTISIDGMDQLESDRWLAFLFEHVKSPELQMRYRWNIGDVGFWDNRSVQHYAVADYDTRRVMQRVTLLGDPPAGVGRGRAMEAVAA